METEEPREAKTKMRVEKNSATADLRISGRVISSLVPICNREIAILSAAAASSSPKEREEA